MQCDRIGCHAAYAHALACRASGYGCSVLYAQEPGEGLPNPAACTLSYRFWLKARMLEACSKSTPSCVCLHVRSVAQVLCGVEGALDAAGPALSGCGPATEGVVSVIRQLCAQAAAADGAPPAP